MEPKATNLRSNAKSKQWFDRSLKVAPGGVHSPVRAFRAVGGTPLFFERGNGATLRDVDGNEYVDFCMSWGALSLGHCHPKVMEAVRFQLERGTHYGTPTPWDVQLAEFILKKIAPFDRVRFVSSGTEAVMTSLRLARGITGRNKIVKMEGTYHGHVDSLLVSAGSGLVTQGESASAGITPGCIQDTLVLEPFSIPALEKVFAEKGSEIAALIVEPILANNGLFELGKEYLQACRDLTKKSGALLIFDEVITGFRVGWDGSKGLYGVEPDLGTYGKILGGGMPVGAIAGSHELMEQLAPNGRVYQAGTLSGNPVAMAAGLATLQVMDETNHFEKIEKVGKYLDKKIEELKSKVSWPFHYHRVQGLFWLCPGIDRVPKSPADLGASVKEAFRGNYHRLLEKGIYLAPSAFEVGFLSAPHTEGDIDRLIEALGSL